MGYSHVLKHVYRRESGNLEYIVSPVWGYQPPKMKKHWDIRQQKLDIWVQRLVIDNLLQGIKGWAKWDLVKAAVLTNPMLSCIWDTRWAQDFRFPPYVRYYDIP